MSEFAWPAVAVFGLVLAYRLGLRVTAMADAGARFSALSLRLDSVEAAKAEMEDALEAARETVLKLADHEDRLGAVEMRSGMEPRA